jgi:exonuclease VII small subunit
MIDRKALRREIEEHRANIERRQAELDQSHEAIMAGTREALERAREVDEPVIYKTMVDSSPCRISESDFNEAEPEWLDATAIAIAETRAELRAEFEAATASLRTHIEKLEAKIEILLALLRGKPARPKRAAPAAEPLRLVKP